MLEKKGVFLGLRKDSNNEAKFFIKLNDLILREFGGTWDSPRSIIQFQDPQVLDVYADFLLSAVGSVRSIEYWGRHILRRSTLKSWGWKDPRNTFTLPIWLKIFPDAKVVCIKRNLIDVGVSLATRSENLLQIAKGGGVGLKIPSSVVMGVECLDVERAIALGVLYSEELNKVEMIVPRENYHEIKFEALSEEQGVIENLFDFLGLEYSAQEIDDVRGFVVSENAYKFKRSGVDYSDIAGRLGLGLDGYIKS
jgi:hypothetical protein